MGKLKKIIKKIIGKHNVFRLSNSKLIYTKYKDKNKKYTLPYENYIKKTRKG